ncbi:Uncharacterized protein OBRU01_04108 [Operophtera brumata]|uniref:Uncharacterized protein n=1 Tax=Operophtera brumata TaxID=104452 RepID=A0A0L7LI28_OPEBR|nr:Uncharacterized protein OBRU01_04108 [Operophtera brumata]
MAPETVVTVDHNKPAPQGGPPQQQGGALDWLKINVDYFKTPPGLLKVVELVSESCHQNESSSVNMWYERLRMAGMANMAIQRQAVPV